MAETCRLQDENSHFKGFARFGRLRMVTLYPPIFLSLRVLFFTIFLFFGLDLMAQKAPSARLSISGKVLNEENSAREGATVTVFRSGERTTPAGVVSTDSGGAFKIMLPKAGKYRVEISFTGYETFKRDSITIDPESAPLVLPDIRMKPSEDSTLEGALVVHPKPMFEQKDGTITMNVESTPMSASSSGAELIKNMPMVSTDPEGRIVVKGKQPIILIDDKPVEMNGQQLADLLESLPGSAIEKIELMQNPPPQYANNEGGVINIVTKKGVLGWTGKATVMAGTIGQTNANINLNYRSKKITFSGVAGTGIAQVTGNGYSLRENQYADSSNQFETISGYTNHNTRPNFRAQLGYEVNTRNQWSLTLQGNGNWYNNHSLTTYKNINRFGEPWKLSQRSNQSDGHNMSFQTQLGYTWFGKNKAEKLQVVASYAPAVTESYRLFFQEFLTPEFEKTGIDSTQGQSSRNPGGNGSLRLDYQKPLKKKAFTLTSGAAIGIVHQHNVLQTLYWDKQTGEAIVSPLLSTDNQFRQQVWSVRAGMNVRIKKTWTAIGSLQLEGTHFDFRFNNNLPPAASDYTRFLPSVTIRKDISKLLKSAFVYRKSIRRPGMDELNPAVDYSDPYNLRFGNPFLLPSMAHNFDLNLNWNNGKSYINGSLGYNQVEDIINRIRTLMDDGKTYATFRNIATRKEYEAGIWSGYSFSRKWRVNFSGSYVYNAYGEKEKELLKYRNGSSVTINLNGNFTASPMLAFDAAVRYNAYADPQGRSRSNISTQMGAQFKLMDRRLILAAAAIDPFTRQEITSYSQGPNFIINSYRTAITRNFRLSASWVIQQKRKR